jgi:hypothetical protein
VRVVCTESELPFQSPAVPFVSTSARPPRSNQTEATSLLHGSIGQDLVEELADGAMRFGRIFPVAIR